MIVAVISSKLHRAPPISSCMFKDRRLRIFHFTYCDDAKKGRGVLIRRADGLADVTLRNIVTVSTAVHAAA